VTTLTRLRRRTGLYEQAARTLVRRGHGAGLARLGPLDERPVFVVGSPRSGTTFIGRSLGSLPGFVDLGELAPFKAAVPELAALPPEAAGRRIRRTLALARRLGLVAGLRPVEQTPEGAFLVEALRRAYPGARFVHAVRDGRDVAASLLRLGWLSSDAPRDHDDVGAEFGSRPRFWVEPERAREFAAASNVRRAAWAWRRYVSAARSARGAVLEVRYERLVAEPTAIAEELASFLDVPAAPLVGALGRARADAVGRHAHDLTDAELAEVLDEAGELLRELGYV
jgi:hypothetical protein